MATRIDVKKLKKSRNSRRSPMRNEDIFLHTSLVLPLTILQCFGFFPIQGIAGPDYQSLSFSWGSLRAVYALATFVLFCLVALAEVHKIVFVEFNLGELSAIVFYSCGIVAWLAFLRLAKDWPSLVKNWYTVELNMKNLWISTNLRRKLNLLAISFLLLGAIEHSLVKSYKLVNTFKCTRTTSDALRHYFINVSDSHIFSIVSYSLWKGLVLQVTNIQMTFSWTYVDVFIILISTSFTLRVRQLVMKVKVMLKTKVRDMRQWRSIREEHDHLCRLCSILDERISYIILLSYWTNIYFILIQLFSSLRYMKDGLEKAYFFLSFGFLILRIVSICLYGSSINNESEKILPLLLSVSTEAFNFEIERFIEQVTTTTLALTGKHFFKITRDLILKIAGAIVTYELVLIQFNINLLKTDAIAEPQDNPTINSTASYWLC